MFFVIICGIHSSLSVDPNGGCLKSGYLMKSCCFIKFHPNEELKTKFILLLIHQ